MREPTNREVPLMASVGLLLEQAVRAVGAAHRGDTLTEAHRSTLSDLQRIIGEVAKIESAPLGIYQASALHSHSEIERLEALADTRSSATDEGWIELRDQLNSVLTGTASASEAQRLRESLSELGRTSLARTAELVDWRPPAGDEWNTLRLTSSSGR